MLYRPFVKYLVAICGVLLCGSAAAQTVDSGGLVDTVRTHAQIFDLNLARINPTPELETFAGAVDSAGRGDQVTRIEIEGAASPDGPVAFNTRLALRRAQALRNYFQSHTLLPDTLYHVSSVGEDWEALRRALPAVLSASDVRHVEYLIASQPDADRREQLLRKLEEGRIWNALSTQVFPSLRRASMTVSLRNGEQMHYTVSEPEPGPAEPVVQPIAEEPQPTETAEMPAPDLHWYLKSNIPAWALFWTNIAVEFDCASHWSVALPIYYSGFNYFTSKRKGRLFTLQPEARYWFRPDNQGLFVGAHLGLGWYNIAVDDAVRYQDHAADTPALGGGISAGYRMGVGRSNRWHLEFALGAGVYKLDYDKFINRHNGPRTDRMKRTFVGIDNAAVSVCYNFGLKKGGDR